MPRPLTRPLLSSAARWAAILLATILTGPVAAEANYSYLNIDAYRMRIWYENTGLNRNTAEALKWANEYYAIYDSAQQIMLGRKPCSPENPFSDASGHLVRPDGYLEIYLLNPKHPTPKRVDLSGLGPNGQDTMAQTYAQGGKSRWCDHPVLIIIDITQHYTPLQDVFAHEIFHAFQATFDDNAAAPWLKESTAEWFEDYVFPEENDEWHALQDPGNVWSTANGSSGPIAGPMDANFIRSGRYSTYIWFYYLTRQAGYYPNLIGQIFDRVAHGQDPMLAIRDLTDWKNDFKQFALYNWNQDPVDVYRDVGQHIRALTQQTRKATVSSRTRAEIAIELNPTQVGYYEVQPVQTPQPREEAPLKQLVVDLSKLHDEKAIDVQAIVTIGTPGTPSYQGKTTEDWTDKSEKRFCLNRATENVTDIVLIVSNRGIAAAGGKPVDQKITAHSAQACDDMPGNFFYQASSSCSFHDSEHSVSMSGMYSIQSSWTLKFSGRDDDETNGVHYRILTESHYNVSGNGTESYAKRDGKIYAYSRGVENTTASGVSHNPPRPGEAQYEQDRRSGAGDSGEGDLYIYTQDGQDHYEITLQLAGVQQFGRYSQSTIESCLAKPPKPPLRHSLSIDYGSGGRRSHESGCNAHDRNFSQDPEMHLVSNPLLNNERLFTGTFNRRSGIIQASVTGHSSQPTDAMAYTADSLRTLPDNISGKPLSCTGTYQAQLRIPLPSK